MSSQRGNVQRSRTQKHTNKTAFKNNLYDKSKKIQEINRLEVCDVCQRCKEIIEWKIKYKKYKPLTVPKKCTKCFGKTVKQAYNIICVNCAKEKNLCAKCGGSKEIIQRSSGLTPAEEAAEEAKLQMEIGMLSERERRTFLRLQEQGKLTKDSLASGSANNESGEDSDIEIINSDDENNSDIEILKSDGISNTLLKDEQLCTENVARRSQQISEKETADCSGCDISNLSLSDKS